MVVLAFVSVAALAQAPDNPAPGATTPAVTILEPRAGAKLAQDFVAVKYELSNPNAVAGTSNFRVQLDDRDPVQTASTTREFPGLQPGVHNVSVWLVDANGTPVQGSQATVQFILLPPNAAPQSAPQNGAYQPMQPLPAGSSPLPLLS